MKKIITLFLSLILICGLYVPVFAASTTATLGGVPSELKKDTTTTITVNLSGTPTLTAADIEITLGNGLELVSGEWKKDGIMKDFTVSDSYGVIAFSGAGTMEGTVFSFVVKGKTVSQTAQNVKVDLTFKSGSSVVGTASTSKTVKVICKTHVYDNAADTTCNVCQCTKTGWVKNNNEWYYYENGSMIKNAWRKDSVGWVFLGKDGAMLTNTWCTDSKGWCYVGADGYCVTNKWVKDSKGWCYLNANGNMVINNWVKDGGKWYFLDANGYMVSNAWRKDSKGWCYLTSSGAMATNAWVKDSIGWCYVGANGYCVTNKWVKDSKGWCYLNANGNMVVNNWVNDGGKWYFMDANGYMASNTSKYWNGKKYYFNASGVCTNP